MSRIGKKPISLPSGVTVTVSDAEVVVKGPKGSMVAPVYKNIKIDVADTEVSVTRNSDDQQTRANHGLVRSLIQNCVIGVTDGYKKTLKLVGTGYRVQAKGQGLSLTVGYSHPIEIDAVEGVRFSVEGNDTIHVEGISKQVVGQVAADIRKIRPPEPYKGKGVRYEDEQVKTKPGKTAA